MPTYSIPIQPSVQLNYSQPFDIVPAPWNRSDSASWYLATASSPFTTPLTYARNTAVDFGSTFTYGPSLTATNDTYAPFSGSTTAYYQLDQRTMFLRPLTPVGLLGPATDGTPTPAGATGWELDPGDTLGGQWLGDYKVSINWRIFAGVQSRPGAATIGIFSPSPLLPSVTANLRLLPATFFNESVVGTTWSLTNYRWPGAWDAGAGTLLHSHVLPGGTNAFHPSIGGDLSAETFTIPGGTDTLALYTTCNQVEGPDAAVTPPDSLYTHPPYYEDYYIARAFLAITRDLRPQRYRWIFPDVEVSYPINEQRRSSNSAFLGRRR